MVKLEQLFILVIDPPFLSHSDINPSSSNFIYTFLLFTQWVKKTSKISKWSVICASVLCVCVALV